MEGCLHECAVCALCGHNQAAELTSYGLRMLQHRGPEASGIVSCSNGDLLIRKQAGLVRDVFTPQALTVLPGDLAIGHNRYATCGGRSENNHQPHIKETKSGVKVAGASNGDLPRYKELRKRLEKAGYKLDSTNDGELIVALVVYYLNQGSDELEAIRQTMKDEDMIGGAYSCVFIIKGTLWAFRDPLGFRPLVLGRLGSSYMVASETCAFDVVGATYIRQIFPGQIVRIDRDNERSFTGVESKFHAFCVFELIYFARPDGKVFGVSVSQFRKELGSMLWQLHPKDADVVIAVPDSSTHIAIGMHRTSGIIFDIGLVRSHYAVRGFLQPEQVMREMEAKFKYNPDREVVNGKRVIVVDDSIVRSTTARKLVRMLRNAGAREVHFRVGSPPIKYSCLYGIDTPTCGELVASSATIEEIRQTIEVDTLGYLSLEALKTCLPNNGTDFCFACFTGQYPHQDKIPPYKLET